MNHCLACGRELPPGQGEVCAECQAQGKLAAPAGAKAAFPHRVTLVFLLSNVGVFVLMVALGVSFTDPWVGHLFAFGGTQGYATLVRLEVWRLLTSNYLHDGIIHLLLNMYCLWGLGRLVEVFYSKRDYALLYTFAGIAGSMLGVVWHPNSVSVGASGAIFGLAGVLLTTLRYGRLALPETSRKLLFREILQFAGINLVAGLLIPRVSNAGHIGGLIAGMLVGLVMGKRLDPSPESRSLRTSYWVWLWLGLAIVFLIFRVLRVGWIVVE